MDFALCVVVADHLDASEIQLTETSGDLQYDFTYHVFEADSDVKKWCTHYNRLAAAGWYVCSNDVVVFIKRFFFNRPV